MDAGSPAKAKKSVTEVREGGQERILAGPAFKCSHDSCRIQVLVPGYQKLLINRQRAKMSGSWLSKEVKDMLGPLL